MTNSTKHFSLVLWDGGAESREEKPVPTYLKPQKNSDQTLTRRLIQSKTEKKGAVVTPICPALPGITFGRPN